MYSNPGIFKVFFSIIYKNFNRNVILFRFKICLKNFTGYGNLPGIFDRNLQQKNKLNVKIFPILCKKLEIF
jgi:hypothetical protein